MRAWRLKAGLVGGIAATSFVLFACGTDESGTCSDTLTCAGDDASTGMEAGADGPTTLDGAADASHHDGGADGGDAMEGDSDIADTMVDVWDGYDGFTCDPSQDPMSEPCVIADGYGVFVAASGDDTNGTGTMEHPYKTLGKAVGSLGTVRRVYACADGAAYNEQLTISAQVDLFGGFSCANNVWAYTGTASKLTASSPAFGLKVDAGSQVVNIEDFEVDGANATGGGTSVTVWLNASTAVTLKRVTVTGGTGDTGAMGANGSATPNYTGAIAPAAMNASTVFGGLVDPNSCTDTSASSGGPGGSASGDGTGGTPAYTPADPAGDTGAGGMTSGACAGIGTGQDGSYGPAGTAGAAVTASGVFTLATNTWSPAPGAAGGNGGPGQGGGGGAGKAGSGGGGGGAGGCGGTGGGGGTAGGASFAVLAVNSPALLDHVTVNGAAAGVGGPGGPAVQGQGGAAHGNGTGVACSGGNGAPGGGGGGGGGGTGGLSVALAYVGTSPTVGTASTVTPYATAAGGGAGGTAGAAPGGVGIPGATGSAGTIGQALASLAIPTQ
jgi:hypothetical protein